MWDALRNIFATAVLVLILGGIGAIVPILSVVFALLGFGILAIIIVAFIYSGVKYHYSDKDADT